MKKKLIYVFVMVLMCMTMISVADNNISYAQDTGEGFYEAVAAVETTEEDTTDGTTEGTTEEGTEEEPEAVYYDLADAVVTLAKTSYEYTGKEFRPDVTDKYDGKTLTKETDYTVTYKNNIKAGTATVTVKGTGEYIGECVKTFKITPISITKATVKTKYSNYSYIKKTYDCVTVTYKGKSLKKGVDYTITYKNNRYPGVATYTVKGIGNYKGTVSGNFYIAKASNLTASSKTNSTVVLRWNKLSNVTGYKVYVYSPSKETWRLWKTVPGSDKNYFKVTKLVPSTGYKFKVCSYVTAAGKTYKGEYSNVLYVTTKPATVSVTSLKATPDMKITVKWDNVKSTGYQIKLSRNSSFDGYSVYKVASKYSSKKIKVSKDKQYYYVKVRAYRTVNGVTSYGAWSKTKKVKTDDTAWMTVKGEKFYYRNGKKVYGHQKIAGNPYYFDTKTGECRGASKEMWSKIKGSYSKTRYLVTVDRKLNRLCIYEGKKNSWNLKYYWKCATGAAETKTPRCNTLLPKKESKLKYIGGHRTYTCWYATRFYERCFFHSVIYNPASKTSIQDGRLGANISHGCVRLKLEHAEWIYDNIKAGTRVIVYGKVN